MNDSNNFPSLSDKFKQIIADANLDVKNDEFEDTKKETGQIFQYEQFIEKVKQNYIQKNDLKKYNKFMSKYFQSYKSVDILKYLVQQFVCQVQENKFNLNSSQNDVQTNIIVQKNKIIKNFLEDSKYANSACQQACNLCMIVYKYLVKLIKDSEENKIFKQKEFLHVSNLMQKDLRKIYDMSASILKYMSNLENYYSESYYWNLEQQKERKKFDKLIYSFQQQQKFFDQIVENFEIDKDFKIKLEKDKQKAKKNQNNFSQEFKNDLQKLLQNIDQNFVFKDRDQFEQKYNLNLMPLKDIQQKQKAFQDHQNQQQNNLLMKTHEILYLYNYFYNLLNIYKSQTQRLTFEETYEQFLNQNEKIFRQKIKNLQQELKQKITKNSQIKPNEFLPHFTFELEKNNLKLSQRRQTIGTELTARNGFQKNPPQKDLLKMLFIQAEILERK